MNKDSKKSFHQKVAYIQATLKAPKGQYNSFGKYKYRNCEDILQAVKPLLGELTLTISDSIELIGDRYYVRATVCLTDGENTLCVEGLAREAATKKGMDESQITGAASSYARKYALNGMFAIDDTKDADSSAPVVETPKKKAPAQSSNPKPGTEDYKRLLAKAIEDLSQAETVAQLKIKGKGYKIFAKEEAFINAGLKRKQELDPDFSDIDPREIESQQKLQLPQHFE